MKQPSMFHKSHFDRSAYDSDNDTDDDDYDDNNPLSPIIAAIQQQQGKKTATLPKNNTSDPMGGWYIIMLN